MKSATPPADSQDGSTPGILQRAKAGAAEFAASAKAAAHLAAKQAERTKINQISLPAAFQSLGKQLHAAGSYREELASYYQSIDDLQAKIQTLNSASSAEAAPQGVAEKAKALGRATKELAESKALGLRLNQAFADLGKVAFDKHGEQTAAQSAVSPIIESQKRIAVLESEIRQLNAAYAGKRLTPKRMLIAAAVLLVLIGAYAVFHRRSGNVWTEYHEKEVVRSKAEFEPMFQRRVATGDSAWDAGKKADAVQEYVQLLAQFCGHGKGDATYVAELHKPEMTRVAGRTIDFLADSGNEETAKDLIKRADESNLVVVYSSPNANRLVPAARAEAKADLEKWSQFNAEWEAEQNRGNQALTDVAGKPQGSADSSAKMKGSQVGSQRGGSSSRTASYNVSKGAFKGNVAIELKPPVSDEISLKEFEWDDPLHGARLNFKLTWSRGNGRPVDPWHYSVYDSSGTKLEGGVVVIPDSMTLGQTVKAHILVGFDNKKSVSRIEIHP